MMLSMMMTMMINTIFILFINWWMCQCKKRLPFFLRILFFFFNVLLCIIINIGTFSYFCILNLIYYSFTNLFSQYWHTAARKAIWIDIVLDAGGFYFIWFSPRMLVDYSQLTNGCFHRTTMNMSKRSIIIDHQRQIHSIFKRCRFLHMLFNGLINGTLVP